MIEKKSNVYVYPIIIVVVFIHVCEYEISFYKSVSITELKCTCFKNPTLLI